MLDIGLLEPTNSSLINVELVTSETSITANLLTEAKLSNEENIQITARAIIITDNESEVRRHMFEYMHSRLAVSNQIIDLSQQPVVVITSIIGEHNHLMQSDTALFTPKYRKLSSEILKKIKFYKFQRLLNQQQGEVQQFIEYLMQLKHQDPNWIINIIVDPYNN
ncbi:1518_t:CDS:2 [Scutellospora calospora]|uniref:1518_t:CDS:1 n=1 Tax=Scutellospora calospora TaxID=85575 RepID=A0ACA9KVB4_9GLOM|nr:1518_t:CDS:2 [Scutellospora calospora]